METRILHKNKGAFITMALLAVLTAVTAQTTHNISVTNVFTPSDLTIQAGDEVVWTNSSGTSHNINGTLDAYPDNPVSFGRDLGTEWVYSLVFTVPGIYDYHCDPHLEFGMTGEITVVEATEENFTLNFTGMTPHLGQNLWLALIEQESGTEVERVNLLIEEADFNVEFLKALPGTAYNIDFFADHNGNGFYDAPPADHAWRLTVDDIATTTSLDFVHNTTFTDVDWQYKLTLMFTGMTPHLNQLLELYLYDNTLGAYVDTVELETITENFIVVSYGLDPGNSYNIDFFADHNGNGIYDIPPTDHAWRIVLDEVMGDTAVEFVHNTTFTDIFQPVGIISIPAANLNAYPNPAKDFIIIEDSNLPQGKLIVKLLSITGQELLSEEHVNTSERITLNLGEVPDGLYLIELKGKTYKAYSKIMIQK